MKKIILIFSLLLAVAFVNFSHAQTPASQASKTNKSSAVRTSAQEMPSFPGGEEKLALFLKDNIQYPQEAKANNKEGKVYVSFVVDATGKVTDVRMEKRMAYGMDQEAMRVVRMMPDWTPGKENGQPVAVQMTLPIHFALSETPKSK